MIHRLFIQNLVLIDRAEIHFGPGLNILTGETGSGKSALLSAIRLILGERADSSLIRHGTDLAVIEATIGTSTIRREIHRSGKSRAFIQDELVSLQELREQLSKTVEIIDQGSAFALASPELQQKILDDFANSTPLLLKLQSQKVALREIDQTLTTLLAKGEAPRRAFLQEELALMQETHWLPNEEETLNEEHHLLTHAQEIQERTCTLFSLLTEGDEPVLPLLKRLIKEKLPSEPQTLLTSGIAEIEEALHLLTTHLSTLEANPQRLTWIESRIGQIESLKRRLRTPTHAEHLARRQELEHELHLLDTLDLQIQEARTKQAQALQKVQETTASLKTLRQEAAPRLIAAVLEELRSLNLPNAELSISVDDTIAFLFSANKGHPLLPLSQVASGGELSRLLFALKTLLSSSTPACLIFDEIDSNVGGTTASMLGQKLQTLAHNRQLICITHFVQVAKHALHHFRVSKSTIHDTTFTHIHPLLTPAERSQEYTRMLGVSPT